jgi:hypothetical protein
MAVSAEQRRPLALLLVYTWDMVRAIFALIGALTAFGGAITVGGRTVDLPVGAQVVTALAAAALAAALIVVGTRLTRHQLWVRRAQIVVLLMAIAMATGSFTTDQLIARDGLDVNGLFGVLAVSLVDLCAVVGMTSPKVVEWFDEPGQVPLYLGGLVAFWAATMVAFVALRAAA